ncbi:MAG: T9SS type A sorting domain-containing protein [Crocinitomicaceae bacterium]|nr:T9SS type A sorting domain-containing protein [Crocinitomicaceae bacterium]MBP6032592.1 T9SS type A sorting domain-containing protein [Crocinitomicaceae bacterium]
MKKIILFSIALISSIQFLSAQVTSINLLYNSIPGIGCHSNMSVCTNTGSLPESGAQIVVDWMDGSSDNMTVFSSPNSQNCYIFEHNYSQVGVYNAFVTVTSGTSGQPAGSSTIEWVITNTSNCGFFNVITMLNPTATFLQNIPYEVTNSAGVTTTIYPQNSFGNAYYTELDVNATPYTVGVSSAWLQNNGYIQTSPDFIINSFDATGHALGVPMNMTLECSGNGLVSNLEVTSAAAYQFIAPIQQGNVNVQVCNVSCGNYANSTIKIAIPTGVTPNLSNLPNASFANDTVTITEAYLSGCMSYGFPCSFAGNTPAGTIFDFVVEVSAQGEQDLLFNNASFVATVLNSYDPNDKQCQLPTFIQPNVQENLQFTVRFQNDGNYPALNVVVRDTISTNLDLSTFRFIGSKHPVSYSIDAVSREVVFRFSGIQLLPSVDSLEGSQGYFTYEIKELPNLSLNSEIKNTAYIYFDFNPAIITNTTLNINGDVGLSTQTKGLIELYPNPSNGIIQITGVEHGQLRMLSLTGQLVYEKTYEKGEMIDLSSLNAGMYFLQMYTEKGEFNQKVNLMK